MNDQHDELLAAVDAFDAALGNRTKAAELLGIPRQTFNDRYRRAEAKGLTGNTVGGPTLEGFSVSKVMDLYGPDGELKLQWRGQDRDRQRLNEQIDALRETLTEHVGVAPLVPLNPWFNENLAAVYPIVDHHNGMYSWALETGQNYDLDIAERVLNETSDQVMAATPNCAVGVILNLGDFYHSNDDTSRTSRSGAILSTDGRHYKVLKQGVRLLIRRIDQALLKHSMVIVRNLPGNHDELAIMALTMALAEHYRDIPRVVIEESPSPFYFWEWGRVMVGAHHGDYIKPAMFPGVMAATTPKMWGETEFRYAYSGHIHHRSKGPQADETYGVEWETFQASAARDDWNNRSGFTSKRSMTAIVFDKELGEALRVRKYITG